MSETTETAYQVLARKYRPARFEDLIGQDDMVRTLRNAFAAERIAQAFMMTGIRGTGKTTTARIIAKGLNCTGRGDKPTTDPCGTCDACVGIAEGRHVDVIEMDAASRTGVNDIRSDVLDSVNYAPTSARYKVYIIDEVHMLSKSAFNALLKTLEEPPAHVKFIFATTEIRMVPVTVLSRCQRFDLRRIEPEVMIAHLRKIATAEGADITDEALGLLTRAAEGSVRDAVSLLDQAISHGLGETTVDQVRAMLGLADRGRVMDLFEMVMAGNAAGALTELGAQYANGADPMAVLRDLAEITHWLSVLKITPEAAEDPTIAPDERRRGLDLADRLPMRVLSRTWQMLLKALEEVSTAPNSMMAAEMAIIRLTHMADLPTPEDLVRKLADTPPPPIPPRSGGPAGPDHGPTGQASRPAATPPGNPSGGPSGGTQMRVGQGMPQTRAQAALAQYQHFDQIVQLIRDKRDLLLLMDVERGVRLVSYVPGQIVFEPSPLAGPDLANRLGQALRAWTGLRWTVAIESGGGAPSIHETRNAARAELETKLRAHPLVAAVFDAFPGAKITDIRTGDSPDQQAAEEALPEVEGEWDPFEED